MAHALGVPRPEARRPYQEPDGEPGPDPEGVRQASDPAVIIVQQNAFIMNFHTPDQSGHDSCDSCAVNPLFSEALASMEPR